MACESRRIPQEAAEDRLHSRKEEFETKFGLDTLDANLALGRVNPVTHAVGNTIKRVVIIIASVIAFNTPISRLGAIGSSIAITGTLLYSLAKNKYG